MILLFLYLNFFILFKKIKSLHFFFYIIIFSIFKIIYNYYKMNYLYLNFTIFFFIIIYLVIINNFNINILLLILSNLLFKARNFLKINYYFNLGSLIGMDFIIMDL